MQWLIDLFVSKIEEKKANSSEPTDNKKAAETHLAFKNKLQKELEVDEGVKYEIYKDHLGYPTFGIGHLVTEADPEYGMAIGTKVTKKRVGDAFRVDIETSVEDCKSLFTDWDNLPDEVRLVTANMAFNLGRKNLSKFKNFRKAINRGDWKQAAVEMEDSRWYKQVTNRAERLKKRILAV